MTLAAGEGLTYSERLTYDGRPICPVCGTENSAGRVYCAQCGERLAPADEVSTSETPAESASDATRPKSDSGSTYLPDWLRRLRAAVGFDQPAARPATPDAEPAPAEVEPTPEAAEPPPTAVIPPPAAVVPPPAAVEPPLAVEPPPAAVEAPPPASEPTLATVEPAQAATEPAPATTEPPTATSEPGPPQAEVSTDDWLATLRENPPQVEETPSTSPAHYEETPDWIRKLVELSPEDEEPAAVEPADQEAPDWLTIPPAEPVPSTQPPTMEQAPAIEPEPSPIEESGADIFGIAEEPVREQQPPAEVKPSAEPEEASEELPSWLRDIAATPAEVEQPAAQQTAVAEQPPIAEQPIITAEPVAAVEPEAPSEAEPVPAPAPATEEEIPSWIKSLQPAAPEEQPAAPEDQPAEPARPAEPAQAPAVQELASEEERTVEEPPPVQEPLSLEEQRALEEWRALEEKSEREEQGAAELEADRSLPIKPTLLPEDVGDEEADAESAMPEWLRLATSVERSEEPEPAVPIEEEIEPARADEVPEWLAALKPPSIAAPTASVADTKAAKGLLDGLPGVLPLAAAIMAPHVSGDRPVKAEAPRGGHLFESILAEPPPTAEATVPSKVRRKFSFRALVYALLMLAVAVPFFLPDNTAGYALAINDTPAAKFFDTLRSVPSNGTVVMVFDYEPSVAGEMDLMAKAMVRDLAARNVKIIAVSTLPTGPQVAQQVLAGTAVPNANYGYGTGYVNLGYIAGQEAGLLQLATAGLPAGVKDYTRGQTLDRYAAAANFTKLTDARLIIELAGSEQPLKLWMEQAQPYVNVPIIAGVSAAVEPRAQTYFNAKQLSAYMSGLMDAARLEVLENRPGLAVASVNAQTWAQVVLVVVVVLGNVMYWVSRWRGKKA